MPKAHFKVLVVGGTGPTGPYVLNGLLERGCEVTILHRGVHEPEGLPEVRHIHADPHFFESVSATIGDERFDAVIAMYGRLEILARVFENRCDRFIAVGGMPVYAGYLDPGSIVPRGMKILTTESSNLVDPQLIANEKTRKFVSKVAAAEEAVFSRHRAGAFAATMLRYPMIYGPRAIVRLEWSIVKRVLDGRRFVLLPHAGLGVFTRCAAANAARYVLLCLDNEAAIGETFNCSDEDIYSMAQWVEMIATELNTRVEIVDVPSNLGWVTEYLNRSRSDHAIANASKARHLLGYRDAVPAALALAEVVRWLCANPPSTNNNPVFTDPFDYGVEDRIFLELQALAGRCEPLKWQQATAAHMYAHPKVPSLAADHLGR